MKRHWKTVLLVVAVGIVALSVVAVAYGATTRQSVKRGGFRGVCGALMSNPQAFKDMQALRVDHQKDMQAWYDQYGSNPSSAEAQAALQKLRQEHWNDMRSLFDKYGIKLPKGAGPGSGRIGAGACGGGCGGYGAAGAAQGGGYGAAGTAPGAGYGMMGGGYRGYGMMGGGTY